MNMTGIIIAAAVVGIVGIVIGVLLGIASEKFKVEVDENKLVMWSLFTGGDGEYMTKIIDDYNATSPSKQVQSITLGHGKDEKKSGVRK